MHYAARPPPLMMYGAFQYVYSGETQFLPLGPLPKTLSCHKQSIQYGLMAAFVRRAAGFQTSTLTRLPPCSSICAGLCSARHMKRRKPPYCSSAPSPSLPISPLPQRAGIDAPPPSSARYPCRHQCCSALHGLKISLRSESGVAEGIGHGSEFPCSPSAGLDRVGEVCVWPLRLAGGMLV